MEVSLVSRVSSRIAKVTQRNLVLEKKKKKKGRKGGRGEGEGRGRRGEGKEQRKICKKFVLQMEV